MKKPKLVNTDSIARQEKAVHGGVARLNPQERGVIIPNWPIILVTQTETNRPELSVNNKFTLRFCGFDSSL